jgi:hypothetical protein
LTPVDSTTGTGAAAVPRVAIMNGGMPLGDALLTLLRSKISLRAWPSLAIVDSTFEASDAKGGNPAQPSTIDVVPAEPLTDGWYVLAVSDLPPSTCIKVPDI